MTNSHLHLHAIVTFGRLAALATRSPNGEIDVLAFRPERNLLELQTSVYRSSLDHEAVRNGLTRRSDAPDNDAEGDEDAAPNPRRTVGRNPRDDLEELLYFTDQAPMPQKPAIVRRLGQFFDAGCWVIIAPYARGKTVLARGLAEPGEYYQFGEPEGGGVYYVQFLSRLAEFLVSNETMWFVDSIRNLTYMTGGSTGEGGVNNEIFVFIGALSAAARRCDKVLVLTWNPLLPEDSDRFTKVINATISSATGVMTPSEVRREGDSALLVSGRRYGRESDGERTERAFTARLPLSEEVTIESDAKATTLNWAIDVGQPSASIPSSLLTHFGE